MRGFLPEDLYLLEQVEDPRLSWDGVTVAFTSVRMDREQNAYLRRIWTIPSEGGEIQPLTPEDSICRRPRWSPDGALIAFVELGEGAASELRVMPVDGGEPRTLAAHPEAIEELAWSPDGRRVAYLVRDPDPVQYSETDPKHQPGRRITRLVYRHDDWGWTFDRARHIFVANVQGESPPTRLTSGESDDAGLAWSPDGEFIAFASSRHEEWDFDLASDIYLVPSQGGELIRLTSSDSTCSLPSFSPDGKAIAFGWCPTPLDRPKHTQIAVIDVESREVRSLTKELDLNTATFPTVREPVWVEGDLYFCAEDRGNVHLYRVPADGSGKPEQVVDDASIWINGLDVAGDTIAFTSTRPTSPAELHVCRGSSRNELASQKFTAALAGTIELGAPERFTAVSRDGTEVEAWVIKPAGFRPGDKYPALLNIHGGPFTQFGNKLFDEFQVYSGAGYAVVYCNPRGSSGYSEYWGRAIRGRKATPDPGSGIGGVDFEDVMAVAEGAAARYPFIDSDRFGVMGGSYGGFMTSWIIGHTARFKAGVSERAVNNQLSMAWTSDLGPYSRKYFGVSHLEDPQEYLDGSPISYVRNVTTPVLILHNENDLRCPISQAEEWFTALRMLGREVEFIRFPGEGHELSRSGKPRHRVERFRVILDFFGRRL